MSVNELKNWALVILSLFLNISCACVNDGPISDGVFIGLEKMSSLSPHDKKTQWFHENTLTIKGTHVTLEKSPVTIKDGKKLYSASDGGFYTYKGSIDTKGQTWMLNLKLAESDYVAIPIGPHATMDKHYSLFINKDGTLLIDGMPYKRRTP